MTVRLALNDATRRLAATSDTPRLDAELLMAHASGLSRERLLLGGCDGDVPATFDAFIERRAAHEPVAYITGHREFWTIHLAVGPDVLIPRADSETLIEAAVEHFANRSPTRVLDLGTGSGALLLAALAQWPSATGIGIDASAAAIEIARHNARKLGIDERTQFTVGGWEHAGIGGPYDLVLCNPPYVGLSEALPADVILYEPASALFAGTDGLDDYRRIAPLLSLPDGGVACIEIGASQAGAVSALFEAEGFLTHVKTDLGGHDRCLIVKPRI
ncbi:MAG TPA: peptide chain release factor N(5)-glutamine methyltransferase [Sphingomonas sp.]|nr:peptide chain release factor N(5)-glutamine methyltransferase [Sphingomonas sp.]